MTTIVSHSYAAAPTFGNGDKGKTQRSPLFYRQTQGKIHLNRFERIKAYGNTTNIKAGFEEAKKWFNGKGVFGKAIAMATLSSAWAIDFFLGLTTGGIWTVTKMFWPDLNVSGLGRAFHYGVHKSYELEKQNRDLWGKVETDVLSPIKETVTKAQNLINKSSTK